MILSNVLQSFVYQHEMPGHDQRHFPDITHWTTQYGKGTFTKFTTLVYINNNASQDTIWIKSIIVSKLKCKVYNLCCDTPKLSSLKCVSTVAVLIFLTRKTVRMENEHVKLLHHMSCWNVRSVWWMATSKILWNMAEIEWQINALFCFSFRKILRVHVKLYDVCHEAKLLSKLPTFTLQILKTWLSVSQSG